MNEKTFRYRADFFILLFFTFAAAVIGDNAAEALILSQYSSNQVSRMFTVNAVILFLFSLFSMGIVDRFNRAKLYQSFLILYAVVILCAWAASLTGSSWIYLPLFSLAYSGKIFSFFFVWTMANDISDARQGLRDFPIIASGGTLGAIITTFMIPSIVSHLSTSNLLLLWLIPLAAAFLITGSIQKRCSTAFVRKHDGRRKIRLSPKALLDNLAVLKTEPLLRGMAAAYFLVFFLVFNQQFLFYSVVKEKLGSADDISRFLGYFTGISMTMTFLIQLFIAGPITRKLGVIRTLYLLPAGLIIAFASVLIGGISWSTVLFQLVIFGVALRIAFFDSFFSPSYQNFFSSLPVNLRGNSKLAIDGIIKPLAMISSTLWILFVPAGTVSNAALLLAAFAALFTMIRLKKRYISTLVKYLSGYRNNSALSIVQEAHLFNTREGLEQLRTVLAEGVYEIQQFAVDLCVTIDSQKSIGLLTSGFYERSGEVQAYITTALEKSRQPEVIPFLYDVLSLTPFPRVAANAIWSLGMMGHADTQRIVPYLKSETPRIRGNAVVILSRRGDLTRNERDLLLRAMLFHPSENIRAAGLWACSQVNISDDLRADLMHFLKNNYASIIKNIYIWRQFLASLTTLGDSLLLEKMTRCYDQLDEQKQQVLREALVKYGRVHGIETLVLLEHSVDGIVQGVVVEAITESNVHLSADQAERITQFAEKEFVKAVEARDCIESLAGAADPYLQLLRESVREQELNLHVRNLFNSALLLDRSGKLRTVGNGCVDASGAINPQAVEILDTIRSNRVNQLLVSYSEIGSSGRRILPMRIVLRQCKRSSSKLIRETALYIEQKEKR